MAMLARLAFNSATSPLFAAAAGSQPCDCSVIICTLKCALRWQSAAVCGGNGGADGGSVQWRGGVRDHISDGRVILSSMVKMAVVVPTSKLY